MNDLEVYREELANCDAKITEALKERYAIIEKIIQRRVWYADPAAGTGRKAEEETDVQPSQ